MPAPADNTDQKITIKIRLCRTSFGRERYLLIAGKGGKER